MDVKGEDTAFQFPAYLGFSAAMDMPKLGLLGRTGFFDRFEHVTFHSKEQLVELVADIPSR